MRNRHRLLLLSLTVFFFQGARAQTFTEILGRPTDNSITISVLFSEVVVVYFEFGTTPNDYSQLTSVVTSVSGTPVVLDLQPLLPDTRYYYRTVYKTPSETVFHTGPERTFYTQRAPGQTFVFTVEADEHLYDKKGVQSLYRIALDNQARDSADFMLSLGDTFGDDHTPDLTTSEDMRLLHLDYRQFLGAVCHSMPFFFCLGNHEGESGYWLDQTPPENIAVYGTQWRKFYYPNPVPNEFYSGNTSVEPYGIGQPENYYAFTWGDALFVAIDPYWHSPVQIDAGIGGGGGGGNGGGGGRGERKKGGGKKGEKKKGNGDPERRNRDGWAATMGAAQYQWLKRTLEQSKAKYKFVFAHHVLGTGRGAVEVADLFEWGGKNRAGEWEFDKKRPGWAMPVHQLMVKHGVTIFFQGHDHLFARQEKDGVTYQETPNPADTTYTAFNREAYRSGDILPNSGFLRVTVAPAEVKVDYIRAWLAKDETAEHKNGEVAFSYVVKPRLRQ